MLAQGLNDEYGTMQQLDQICEPVPHVVQAPRTPKWSLSIHTVVNCGMKAVNFP